VVQAAARSELTVAGRGEVVPVALRDLKIDASFREGGVNQEHVARLVDLGGHWPPILVSRDGLVIDGVHRAAAARLLGWERIDAAFFDGGPDDALIEFVRRNVYHGLPLTLRERKRAAGRVLHAHPEWSDRRIAKLCAISPKTVGRLRVRVPERPTEEVPHLDTRTRVGRDNKSRPVNSASVRARVVAAIKQRPGASLRSVASEVGVSPETVRIVRMNMRQGTISDAEPENVPATDVPWEEDRALTSCDDGDFVEWFDRTSVGDDECRTRVGGVPLSRIYAVAEEARRRSELWMQFARALEARAGTRK
jgi:hypothetical protein